MYDVTVPFLLQGEKIYRILVCQKSINALSLIATLKHGREPSSAVTL